MTTSCPAWRWPVAMWTGLRYGASVLPLPAALTRLVLSAARPAAPSAAAPPSLRISRRLLFGSRVRSVIGANLLAAQRRNGGAATLTRCGRGETMFWHERAAAHAGRQRLRRR